MISIPGDRLRAAFAAAEVEDMLNRIAPRIADIKEAVAIALKNLKYGLASVDAIKPCFAAASIEIDPNACVSPLPQCPDRLILVQFKERTATYSVRLIAQ